MLPNPPASPAPSPGSLAPWHPAQEIRLKEFPRTPREFGSPAGPRIWPTARHRADTQEKCIVSMKVSARLGLTRSKAGCLLTVSILSHWSLVRQAVLAQGANTAMCPPKPSLFSSWACRGMTSPTCHEMTSPSPSCGARPLD